MAEINFILLKPGSDETRVMYKRSDNDEFMSGDDTNEIIKLLFESFLQRFEENVQIKMRGSEFEFDVINFLDYNFNKTSIYRGGSYINFPKRLKDKKSTINPKNNDYKCFQDTATLSLNRNRINKDPQRISKIKPFINNYNWKDIDFLPTNKDWKKFESNNEVALNILYIPHNKKKSSLEHNDWPFRMLIIGPSGSGKTNTLLHLINNFHPIDKIYLYAKDTDEKFIILISIFNK